MTIQLCPCCGGRGTIDGPPVQLTPTERAIYDAVRSKPHRLSGMDLCGIVYADREDGGPLTAPCSIRQMILKANRRLAIAGERIRATARGGPGARYYLERTAQKMQMHGVNSYNP